ncbi:MAG: NAD(P)-dependent oxidoreductase [Alphaproteobacteria bacterium]|nr:NAD(P)-dependent oxidoreductase [Alphaproteobacteria bacterium]
MREEHTMKEKVGFIGLGNMGKPMAMNLARAGVDLTVYDLNPDTMRDLAALGAKTASSTAEVGENCDIVELVVMNDRQIEEVISGQGQGDGLLAGMKAGGLIIIHSTVSPVTCQRMATVCAERNIGVIDAAVSGAEARSIEGTLTLMVGGDAKDVERARPIFSIVGEDVFHMGAVGMGQAAKLCNNLMSLINMKVVEEGLGLARAAGIDEDQMIEIAKVSTGDSWALRGIKPMRALFAQSTHGAGSVAKLVAKDLVLALRFGEQLGVPLGFTEYAVNRDRAKPE